MYGDFHVIFSFAQILRCRSQKSLKTFYDQNLDILHLNLIDLLPLSKQLIPLHEYTKFQNSEQCVKVLKRIKNSVDLFDTEEGSSCDDEKSLSNQEANAENTSPKKSNSSFTKNQRSNSKISKKAHQLLRTSLDAFAEFYDEASFTDCYVSSVNPSESRCELTKRRFDLCFGMNSISSSHLDQERRWKEGSLLKLEQANDWVTIAQLGNYKKLEKTLKDAVIRSADLDDVSQSDVTDSLKVPVECLKNRLKFTELSSVQLR